MIPQASAEEAGLRYVSDDDARHPPQARRARGSATSTRTASASPTRAGSPGSRASPSRRRGPTSGSARSSAATSRPPAATRGAASSTATTHAGARCATRRSTGRLIEFARALPAHPPPGRSRPPAPRAATREGARAGRPPARGDAHPRRQRGVRAREPQLRPLHAARPPCEGQRHRDLRFSFKGKAGKEHDVPIADRRLARLVRQCQELPGQELFQFVDEDGRRQSIDSGDVNDYLRADQRRRTSRPRTSAPGPAPWPRRWRCRTSSRSTTTPVARRRSSTPSRRSPAQLGNTPAVCRACYVHPDVLDSYLDGTLVDALAERARGAGRGAHALRPEEAAVLGLLQARLAREQRRRRRPAA